MAWSIFWSFCHHEVCRSGWRCHKPFYGLSVTVRSSAMDGGGMVHFWSFCHREVCRGRWRWLGSFSGLSLAVKSSAAYGSGMDHFLVFLSPSGLPKLIAVTWTISRSFCHREFFHGGWRWKSKSIYMQEHGPFSGLSVTVRCSEVYGRSMDHFLVFMSL